MSNNATVKQIVIIGGVAGGASAAARLRRLDEHARIILLERGPDVSFANCGLPYHIGGEISDRSMLALQTPQSLNKMLALDVRVRHEALSIQRENKTVTVRNLEQGTMETLSYDTLILSPGASPIRPPLPGLDHPRVLTLRNLQDMDAIIRLGAESKRVLVIGAGFIGLETAEQFHHLGKDVTLVELQPQVLPQLDPEMAAPIELELKAQGINVITGDGIRGIAELASGALKAQLASGASIETDLVILSIGVKPDTALASACGLTLGSRGHIVVNEFQQTNDPSIYAVGDAVETKDGVLEGNISIPLGGPANRQGRLAADHIVYREKARPYPGSIGTSIVRVFSLAAGITGYSEKRLQAMGHPYSQTVVTDFHHANYYPGAVPLSLKVIWNPRDGRILGAQSFGQEGVDKRLDVLATAIRGKLTMEDLEHLELAYAPPFGAAKDPVNLAGFAAKNMEDSLVEITRDIPEIPGLQVVDLRGKPLREANPVPGAIGIMLADLRDNLHLLDKSRPVLTLCMVGKTSYFAARVLQQNGFNVISLQGGLTIHPELAH
ncbi:MAG: FAD-dependent oxidoreductase [Opitutales bacterium]|nr:FAD-dependent oxidoreductase [Opitutales bacterium]